MDQQVPVKSEPVALPKNAGDLHNIIYPEQIQLFDVEVFRYRNAFVTGSGMCFNRFGKMLKGAYMLTDWVRKEQSKITTFNFIFRGRVVLQGEKPFLVIHNHWYAGYYHWLIDCMPRLLSVQEQFSQLCILLPEKAKQVPFIQDILDIFPQLERRYVPTGKVAKVEHLVIPSHVPQFGNFLRPDLLKYFRNQLVKGEDMENSGNERLYVIRRKSSRRKIINEPEVSQTLQRHGFKEVVLEDHHFREQVRLCAAAKIIVSIHGAGLSNIIFMQDGGHVLELFKQPNPGQAYPMEYQKLASVFGLNYYALLGTPEHASDTFDRANLTINIDELDKLVSTICASDC